MSLTSDVAFDRGLDFFQAVVDQLAPEDWDRASPCDGWSALDVLGHMTTGLDLGLRVMRGEQPSFPRVEHPGDLVAGEPAEAFRELADRCRTALAGADLDLVTDTPMGPRTVADRVAFPAIDLYVHAWDIATAAGFSVAIPEDVETFAHGYLDQFPPELIRGSKGVFGPEVAAPDDATATERFVAWTGRTPGPVA